MINTINNNQYLDVVDLKERKFKLGEHYKSFNEFHFEISMIDEDNEHLEEESVQFEEQYYLCAKLINTRINSLSESKVFQTQNDLKSNIVIQQSNTLLPKLEIKPFDGNPVDWYSFRDMFESLVHKDYNIPAVQKFHLLRNALQGHVANIVNSLNASEENYPVAWDLLYQRCNKPRKIVQTHLKLLMELPEITRDSPTNIRSLKENAQMHINAPKALNLPVDTWDTILIYIICQKLHKNTTSLRTQFRE